MAEQHAKLSDFLLFKAQSKRLSRQYAKLASGGKMDGNIDSEDEHTNKNVRRRNSMMMSDKMAKVTYSDKGKIIPIKELHLAETKMLAPLIFIQEGESRQGINSSMSSRTISTRQTKSRFDPKKNLTVQFESNLEEIFDEQGEREAKDNDSNFSNESYERQKRIEAEDAKKAAEKSGLGSNLETKQSHLSGKLSKISALRRTGVADDTLA